MSVSSDEDEESKSDSESRDKSDSESRESIMVLSYMDPAEEAALVYDLFGPCSPSPVESSPVDDVE